MTYVDDNEVTHDDACSGERCDCEERDFYESRMKSSVTNDTQVDILKTMRTMLAERFDRATPRESAGIARAIKDITKDIVDLEATNGKSSNPLADRAKSWADRIADTVRLS